jgi:hypothetical protein
MPLVVRWARERFHALEAGGGPDHGWRRARWHVQKVAHERAAILQRLRRSSHTNHPTLGLVDVFAATLPTLTFKPGVHVNYAETVLPMRDGLPKLKDFPAELGGSGERVAE